MEVRHKSSRTGNKLNHLIREQIGLDRGYTIAFNAFYLIQSAYKVNEGLARRLAEVTYVDTGDYNLLGSLGSRPTCLLYERGDGAVTATATSIRDSTIGTKVVTSVLYFEEETCAVTLRS